MSDLNDPYARLDQMRGAFERTQGRVDQIQEQLADVTTTTEDDDGLLSVTVGSSGVQELSIDPKAMRLGSDDLAQRLTELIRRGTKEVQVEVRRITDGLVREIQPTPFPPDQDLQR